MPMQLRNVEMAAVIRYASEGEFNSLEVFHHNVLAGADLVSFESLPAPL